MTREDVARMATELVIDQVAQRLAYAGAALELATLARLSAQEMDVLVARERGER